MTENSDPRRRLFLPLLNSVRHGSRSHATCHYKCGNACDAAVPNRTDNPTFESVVQTAMSRRALLKVAGTGALVVATAPLFPEPAVATPGRRAAGDGGALTFEPVEQNLLDELVTAAGYQYAVVMRWGDPVEEGAPEFDVDAQTPEAQAKQFGYNCDFIGFLPLGHRRALLVVNHEYTNEQLMFSGVATESSPTTPAQKLIAMAAHGISVVELERLGTTGGFRPVSNGDRNRRITASTPMTFTGPAAGSEYLKTSKDPSGTTVLGTLNNCAGGMTPWGTTLHGEENVNQYFGPTTPLASDPERRLARYGISTTTPPGRRWDQVDPRFDVSQEPNEPNRFGWVVEVDPYDPTSTPRKRTALGRFKHEGADVQIAEDGRVVGYSGDDERFDYIYKFVSKKKYKSGNGRATRAHNLTLLDEGDLYVAQFNGDGTADGEFDGTGRWIPLVKNGKSMLPNRDVAWVLTFTRLAADELSTVDPTLAPTKMDRPEDIQFNKVNKRVYAALTNNTNRADGATDEANPRPKNKDGHVVEWQETNGMAGEAFAWRLFLVAGDPTDPSTYFAGYDKTKVSAISCPDNVEFDPAGNLWISTDGSPAALPGTNDGLYAVPTQGDERGLVKRFLTVPTGAECSGPLISRDAKSVFVSVQHPGEKDGSTVDSPASTWPDRRPGKPFPRPSVAVVYRVDGGRVGS